MDDKRLEWGLFFCRVSVFVVMAVWALDKFVRPEHAAAVFKMFYFSPDFGANVSYVIGALQMVVIMGFLLGVMKKATYGLVLVLHFISTVSSYKQYLTPYQDIHILFFAAWPMLAACLILYLLRDKDTLFTLK